VEGASRGIARSGSLALAISPRRGEEQSERLRTTISNGRV
jgi:hypothetical protein